MNTAENRRAAALDIIQQVAKKAGIDSSCIVERDNAFYLVAPSGDVAEVAWEPLRS